MIIARDIFHARCPSCHPTKSIKVQIVSATRTAQSGVCSRSPPESGFWPRVGIFLLRETPTPGTYNESYDKNFACTLLYTVVHLLLEEFRFSLHSSWNTQSVYHTSCPGVGVWNLSSESWFFRARIGVWVPQKIRTPHPCAQHKLPTGIILSWFTNWMRKRTLPLWYQGPDFLRTNLEQWSELQTS